MEFTGRLRRAAHGRKASPSDRERLPGDTMGIPGESRTIYHISPVRLWLVPGPLLVLAAVLLVAACFVTDKAGQAGSVVLAIMVLSTAVLLSPLVIYPRHELSARGVTLRQIGYK